MPDWSYHPLFKPLLFRLPAETARRLTLGALALQARTAPGRALFRLLASPPPPPSARVRLFGLDFPSCVGLGPGIDSHGVALEFLEDHFGFGFLALGPVAAETRPRRGSTEPLRIGERFAIARSRSAAAPSAADLAARVAMLPPRRAPIGFVLDGADPEAALAASGSAIDFFTLPPWCGDDPARLARLRAATKRPLLLRLGADDSPSTIDRRTDHAVAAGIDGCVAVAPPETLLLPDGELEGPFVIPRAAEVIRRVVARHGDRLPIIGAGGITTPEEALLLLDAGARLVEVSSGLVYAGPGLPLRIVAAAAMERRHAPPVAVPPPPLTAAGRLGARLLALTGLVLAGAGVAALVLAATIQLLPPDLRFLGMTVADLCQRNACRIVHFMAHDRVSFGGSLIAIGVMYVWLAGRPLRRREAWAFWVFVLSGATGFASFLAYLGYGYLDPWHAAASLLLLPIFLAGLALSFPGLAAPRGPESLFRVGASGFRYSPAHLGRLAITFSAVGMIAGGAIILWVGMTRVFVPQDLEYMRITTRELQALNPRLIPLIAHDRAGFGGGLFSGGLVMLFGLWCGARPGARGLYYALLAAGTVGFGTAIGIHPIVGYVSFIHLLPAGLGALAFIYGMAQLRRPLCIGEGETARFPDL